MEEKGEEGETEGNIYGWLTCVRCSTYRVNSFSLKFTINGCRYGASEPS